MSKADDFQVGGTHYKEDDYQHWNVVIALKWDYLTGCATKYLWRLGKKGDLTKQIEDVGKAIHYLEKKREIMRDELDEQQAAKCGDTTQQDIIESRRREAEWERDPKAYGDKYQEAYINPLGKLQK